MQVGLYNGRKMVVVLVIYFDSRLGPYSRFCILPQCGGSTCVRCVVLDLRHRQCGQKAV